MKTKTNQFFKAWQYLYYHPMFTDKNGLNRFQECLDIDVVKVNSNLDKIEVWLECGRFTEPILEHDIRLDCGGKTFEEAIIKLAKLVKKYYD